MESVLEREKPQRAIRGHITFYFTP